MTRSRIRIAVVGTGAVGGYFGARLAAAGKEVAFLARGDHLAAMRKDGLRIKSPQGDFQVRGLFTADPSEVGPVDLVLFCVKSYGTAEAGKALGPLLKSDTKILSLQNGIDNPDKLAALWGKERTLAGVVYIGAQLAGPGLIDHAVGGRVVMGELGGGVSEGTKTVQKIFSEANVPCVISSEIRKIMWTKLVWNAPYCALSCLARATVKEITESKPLLALALESMEEVRAAAKCDGIDLEPTVIDEALKLSRAIGDFKPSMLQDLEAGKPLEYEALNGIIVKLLRREGKRAPVDETFYAVLKFLDEQIRSGKQARGNQR